MARYKHGTKAVRDSKLSMMIQLGSSEAKPLTEVVTVSMMSFLMKTATEGSDGTPYSDFGPSDRNPFPVIPMASFCETRHFGGALQKERHLPKNYVSATAHIDSQQAPFNVLARLLLSSLERGALAKNVFDMTYILAANEQDELPERALCTIRAVHIHPNDVALPSIFIWGSHNRRRTTQMTRMRQGTTILSSMIGNIATLGERFRSANRDENDDEVDDIDHTSQTHPQYTQEDAKSRIRRNSICVMPSDDPIELAVNELVDILDGVHIPIRRDQLPFYEFTLSIPLSLLEIHNSNDGASHNKDLITMSLLLLLKRGDIKRHLIAADCNIKKAAVRIVESAAWYGQTFPIDTKMCRIELQSGQFFQQGRDLLGQPVFYFRNMGLGPWRGDLDASVAATLYRLDEALRRFTRRDECVQITLIVIVGKPFRPKDRKKLGATDGASTVGDEEELDDMLSTSFRAESSNMEDYTPGVGGLIANPRINPEESWLSHTNKRLVRQLVDLVSAHYPERLHQALIVVDDNQILSLKRLMGSLTLSSFVDSNRTRSKVKFLSKFSELEKYVSKGELVSIAGGLQPIDPSAFELTS